MENELPSDKFMLHEPEWAKLTWEQLQKDAALCGTEWPEMNIPKVYDDWIEVLNIQLIRMEKQSPDLLQNFLYRVDLPEKAGSFLSPSDALAAAVLKREFMKVWFKQKYKERK